MLHCAKVHVEQGKAAECAGNTKRVHSNLDWLLVAQFLLFVAMKVAKRIPTSEAY